MISREHVGPTLPPFTVDAERGRPCTLARATGGADPVPPIVAFLPEMDAPDSGASR